MTLPDCGTRLVTGESVVIQTESCEEVSAVGGSLNIQAGAGAQTGSQADFLIVC